MKKYRIVISTRFGSVEVSDVEAENENEAFYKACEEVSEEIINYAKLEEFTEYEEETQFGPLADN